MPQNEAAPQSPPQGASTSLSLLARDAIVRVRFGATLSGEQYAELLEATRQADTAQLLSDVLLELGQRWNLETSVSRGK